MAFNPVNFNHIFVLWACLIVLFKFRHRLGLLIWRVLYFHFFTSLFTWLWDWWFFLFAFWFWNWILYPWAYPTALSRTILFFFIKPCWSPHLHELLFAFPVNSDFIMIIRSQLCLLFILTFFDHILYWFCFQKHTRFWNCFFGWIFHVLQCFLVFSFKFCLFCAFWLTMRFHRVLVFFNIFWCFSFRMIRILWSRFFFDSRSF